MSTTSWIQGRVDTLLRALDSYGMVMSRAAATELITERVASVAQLMRTTKATAQGYLTDETIVGMAESIAFSLAEESPGADLYNAPRTAAVPINVVGRMVAGLAEACQVRFAERDNPEHAETRVTELVKCLSVLGTIVTTEPTHTAAARGANENAEVTVALPPALLLRVARYLEAAADVTEQGSTPPGFDGDPAQLALIFRDDAALFRTFADTANPSGSPDPRAL